MKLRRVLLFCIITFLGAAADLYTKHLAFRALPEGESSPVVRGYFDIAPTMNPGAAFGLLKGETDFFVVVSVAALIMLAGYIFFYRDKSSMFPVSLGLIAGGVVGNFFDRMAVSGGVRDFLHVHWKESASWPTFNVADSLITVGVVLIFIRYLFFKKHPAEPAETPVAQSCAAATQSASPEAGAPAPGVLSSETKPENKKCPTSPQKSEN